MKIDKTPIHWVKHRRNQSPKSAPLTDRQTDGRGSLSPLVCVCVRVVWWGVRGYKPPEAGANRVNWRYDFCLCSGGELGETTREVPGHNLYFDTLQLPPPPTNPPNFLQSYVCNLLPPPHTRSLSLTRQVNLIFSFSLSLSSDLLVNRPSSSSTFSIRFSLSLSPPGFQFRFCSKFDYLRLHLQRERTRQLCHFQIIFAILC